MSDGTTKAFIDDVLRAVKRMREKGEQPNTLRVNPALLTPERLPWFKAECERLGIELRITNE